TPTILRGTVHIRRHSSETIHTVHAGIPMVYRDLADRNKASSVTFNDDQRLIVLVSQPLHNLRQIVNRHMRLTRRHLLIINRIEHGNVREVAVLQTLSHVNTHHIVRLNKHTPMLILTNKRLTPHVNDDISIISGSNRRSNTANRPLITGLSYHFHETGREHITQDHTSTRQY